MRKRNSDVVTSSRNREDSEEQEDSDDSGENWQPEKVWHLTLLLFAYTIPDKFILRAHKFWLNFQKKGAAVAAKGGKRKSAVATPKGRGAAKKKKEESEEESEEEEDGDGEFPPLFWFWIFLNRTTDINLAKMIDW